MAAKGPQRRKERETKRFERRRGECGTGTAQPGQTLRADEEDDQDLRGTRFHKPGSLKFRGTRMEFHEQQGKRGNVEDRRWQAHGERDAQDTLHVPVARRRNPRSKAVGGSLASRPAAMPPKHERGPAAATTTTASPLTSAVPPNSASNAAPGSRARLGPLRFSIG